MSIIADSDYNKANLRDLIAATGLVISNWIQIVAFSAWVTLKFDGWARKTIGHFYTRLSFVHHLKSIGEIKLDLQYGNTEFVSQLAIFVPCDLDIWLMTVENNRAPLLYCFVHHFKSISEVKLDLQSGDVQFGSTLSILSPVWSWNFTHDLEKQYGTSPMLLQALCIIS